MSLQFLTANEVGRVRRERMGGRSFLVAPFVSLGPRVLNGSKGALYYPRDEIEKNPGVWNNVALTFGHPTHPLTGEPLSATDPRVRSKFGLGHVHADKVENGWRKGEAWFDEELTKNKAPEVYARLVRNQPIDLSTGLYTENHELAGVTEDGQPFDYVALGRAGDDGYRPDHLAVLVNQRGACSVDDGCGINLNEFAMINDGSGGTLNRFCPTGPDGGIDNSCGGDGGGRAAGWDEHGGIRQATRPGGSEGNSLDDMKAVAEGASKRAETDPRWHAEAAFQHRGLAKVMEHLGPYRGGGSARASEHEKKAEYHEKATVAHNQRRRPTVNFWHRLGEFLGFVANADVPQLKHLESGQFLPKGHNRGDRQLQTAAERGFSHLKGNEPIPANDPDDDGDVDTPVTGQGDRSVPDADHIPLPTDNELQTILNAVGCDMAENEDDEEEPKKLKVSGTGMAGSPLSVGLNAWTDEARAASAAARAAKSKADSHEEEHAPGAAPEKAKEVADALDHAASLHDKAAAVSKARSTMPEDTDDGDARRLSEKAGHLRDRARTFRTDAGTHNASSFDSNFSRETSMALTDKQRQQAVGWLTVNCACQKGKEKVLLNRQVYSDAEIVQMVRDARALKTATRNELVVNALGEPSVWNAMPAFIKKKIAAAAPTDNAPTPDGSTTLTDVDDSANEDEEEVLPMFKKQGEKAKDVASVMNALKDPEQLNILSMAMFGKSIADVRAAVGGGVTANAARKGHLITLLTRNYRDDGQKKAAVRAYDGLDVPTLEVLAAGLPPMLQPLVHNQQIGVQRRPAPVFGPQVDAEVFGDMTENADDGPDVLPTANMFGDDKSERADKQRA